MIRQPNRLHGIELSTSEENAPTLRWGESDAGLHGDADSVKYLKGGKAVIDFGNDGDSTDLVIRGAHNSAYGKARIFLQGTRGTLDAPAYVQSGENISAIHTTTTLPDKTDRSVGNIYFTATQNHGATVAGTKLGVAVVPYGTDTVAVAATIHMDTTSTILDGGKGGRLRLGSAASEISFGDNSVIVDNGITKITTGENAHTTAMSVAAEYIAGETRQVAGIRTERRDDWSDSANEAGQISLCVTKTDATDEVLHPALIAAHYGDAGAQVEIPDGLLVLNRIRLSEKWRISVDASDDLIFEYNDGGGWVKKAEFAHD
jgi:hypothetical protein